MRIVAPIFLFPLASKNGLIGFGLPGGRGGLPVIMMYIFVFTFFLGTDATVLPDASCNDIHFFKVPMPLCSLMPVVMMYIFVSTFFQGTDATVLPWDYANRMGRGQQTDRGTLRLLDQIGPWANSMKTFL